MPLPPIPTQAADKLNISRQPKAELKKRPKRIEIEEVDTELPKRKVSSDDVKTLSVELNYDYLSVKELKDKVAEMNGPKLKTKKELLEFLKNKL